MPSKSPEIPDAGGQSNRLHEYLTQVIRHYPTAKGRNDSRFVRTHALDEEEERREPVSKGPKAI